MSKKSFYKIIILILFLFLFFLFFLKKKENIDKMYLYKDIKKKMKTGDIILFSCRKHKSFIDKIFFMTRTNVLGSNFGHVGLIIRNSKDKLYLLETNSPKQCCTNDYYCFHENNKKTGGIRILPLDKILKEYSKKNDGIYAIRFISKEISNSLLMKKIYKYKHIQFQDVQVIILFAFFDFFISHKIACEISKLFDNNKMICSEFLYNILYDCNVIRNYPSKLFWPNLFVNEIFDNITKIKYSKTYEFTIN